MAALGNIGQAVAMLPSSSGMSVFGRNQTVPVTISIPSVAPNTVVFLISRAGAMIDVTAANSAGIAKFYDFDNGVYTAYSNNTGDVWRVTIAAGVVTVAKIFTSNRAMARAWVG